MQKWGLGAFGLAAVAGVIALGASVFGGVAQAQEPTEEGSSFYEMYQEALAEKLGVGRPGTRSDRSDRAVPRRRVPGLLS